MAKKNGMDAEVLFKELCKVGADQADTRDAVLAAWPVGSPEHTAARVVQGNLYCHVRQIIAERDAARAEAAALKRALAVAHDAIEKLTETGDVS